MELVVDDPYVLFFVVGADLDLVRPPTAGKLGEQLVEVRPLVHEVALAIEHDDRVLEAALPSPLRVRLARCRQPVRVAIGVPAGRIKLRIGRPRRAPLLRVPPLVLLEDLVGGRVEGKVAAIDNVNLR